ncbi:MAG: hypothetical protein ACK55Z_21870 [bacterium]
MQNRQADRLSADRCPHGFTRTSFISRPATFQSCTYRFPAASQYEPWVPLKTPSTH